MRHCFPLGESDDDTDHMPCPPSPTTTSGCYKTPTPDAAAVVDPGDAAPVNAWLAANPGWVLSDILITHHHHDHVGGVERSRKRRTRPSMIPPAKTSQRDIALKDNDRINVLGHDFEIISVPGHTLGHIAYYHPGLLFCGDTLFAAGCGRLFEGTPHQMYTSLRASPRLRRTPGCIAPMNTR